MLQTKKILFPTDFSDYSNHALPYAIRLAEIYGAKLIVLHVITLFEHDPYDPEHTFPDIDRYLGKIEKVAKTKTGALAAHATSAPGSFAVEKIVERGTTPYGTILDVADREGVDLVVMTTHGRSGLGHFLLGSVTEKVVRFARCAVLVVKEHENEFVEPESGQLQLKSILTPTDFSDASKVALQYAASLALQFGAELTLLHVIEERINPGYYAAGVESIFEVNPDIREKVRQQLEEFATGAVPATGSIRYLVLEGKAHREINACARKQGIDLIVMGTQGYDEVGDYLIGSTTERTVRHAACPVLVTHQPRVVDGQ